MAKKSKLQKLLATILTASMTIGLLNLGPVVATAADEELSNPTVLEKVELPTDAESKISVKFGTALEDVQAKLPATLVGTVKTEELADPTDETTDVSTDETTDVSTDETTDVSTDETTDVSTDETTDVSTDETTDVSTDETTDVSTDETTDVSTDETTDVSTDETTDVSTDETTDVSTDETTDVSTDETIDVSTDETIDVSTDETIDVSTDETIDVFTNNITDIITTVDVPVTWECEEEYDAEEPADYTFEAVLSEGFFYEGNLPQITVTVEEKINIEETYIITPETENVDSVLKQATADSKPALIQAGTYQKGFTVDGITLYVDGEVEVEGGITLKNATLEGYSGDRDQDLLMVTGNGTLLALSGAKNTLKNVTLSCEGNENGNYITHWNSAEFLIEDSNFSCNNNQTSYGGGIFPGTNSNTLTAINSNLEFSNNGKSGVNASMPQSDGCNPNAKFVITGGSFKANNNGLNGIEGPRSSYTGKLTFIFKNVDVEVTGNGMNPDGGRGDGFSYAYVTLENTSRTIKYTFNVSGNGNNGFDGGLGSNAALDADGYTILANENGGIGINISKLNEGKSESTIQNCTVEANGNGSHGIQVKQPMNIIDSTITANQNAGTGFVFSGKVLQTKKTDEDKQLSMTMTENQNNGLSVNSGEARLDEAIITITNNTTATYGGGVRAGSSKYSTASVVLPVSAAVYNNHADKAGDDIYSYEKCSVTFSKIDAEWTLDDCNHVIDGWYDDSEDARWEAHEEPYHVNEFVKFERNGIASVYGTLALKAAHGMEPLEQDDPDLPDWTKSKSKTATNLNEDFESNVTLSLPAKEEVLESDVVFVLDESSAYDAVVEEMDNMLVALANQVKDTGAAVNVGFVVFRGNAVTKPLARLTPDSIDEINQFITTRPEIGGSNMMAGLEAAQKMLEDSSTADNRKYMVLISDGITYTWSDSYGNQKGVNFANGDSPNSPMLASPDAWATKHGNYIPTNWKSHLATVGSLLDKTIAEKASDYDRDNPTAGKPFVAYDERNDYATTVDIALYQCAELYQELQEKYHCYSVMRSAPTADTTDDPNRTDGDVHPYGPSFMNYLSNGEEVDFTDIQNDIYYLLSAGSQVVDIIGYGTDNKGNSYNFDFVDDLDQMNISINGEILDKTKLEDPQFSDPYITNSYGFGYMEPIPDPQNTNYVDYKNIYAFVVNYYANGQDGKSDECLVWNINVPISNFAPAQLTYTVKLTDPQTAEGTYGVYDENGGNKQASLLTNISATLYPVDSNGESGVPENFAKPTVSYTVKSTDDDDDDDDNDSTTIYYDLIVRYLETGTENVLASPYRTTKAANTSYDVTAYTDKVIEGYSLDEITGDALTGRMTEDKEIIVWYTLSEEDIEDPDTPLTDGSTDSTETAIPTNPGDSTEEIDDSDVPTIDAPQTGNNSVLWLVPTAVLVILFAAVVVARKKYFKTHN
ncbi:MAG: hypothetical protein ACOX6P_05490 [Candidatus Merdivicinus sp.]